MAVIRRMGLGSALALLLVLATTSVAGAATGAPGDVCSPTPLDGQVNVDPSCFEAGDGNLANDLDGLFDWERLGSTPGLAVFSDGTGGTDDIFSGGSKELKPPTWSIVPQQAPAKDDFLAGAAYVDTVPTLSDGDHVFFYGAFQRLSPNGDANMSFELNQSSQTRTAGAGQVPIRTEGDLLITYDGNSSSGIRIGACRWHGSDNGQSEDSSFGWYPIDKYSASPDPGDAIDSNSKCAELTTKTVPSALGSMNSGTITGANTILPTFGTSMVANTFGEIAVDVTRALELSLDSAPACFPYGGLFLHSRSSDTPTSSMKDYITPQPLKKAADCSFEMQKLVGVDRQNGPDESPRDASVTDPVFFDAGDTLLYDIVVTNTGDANLDLSVVDDRCTFPDPAVITKTGGDQDGTFEPGETWTYRCSRLMTAGDRGLYDANGEFVNTASVTGTNGEFSLEQTDSGYAQEYGKVVVDKDLTGGFGDPDASFSFDRFFGAKPDEGELANDPFSLSANDQPLTIGQLVPNVNRDNVLYRLGEPATADGYANGDYDLTQLDCGQGQTRDGRSVDLTVGAGQTVTCTFTNRRKTGTIDVVKQITGPAEDGAAFDLSLDGDVVKAGAHDGEASGPITVPAAAHDVSEDGANLDLYNSSIACVDGEGHEVASHDGTSLADIPVAGGDVITCTITNARKTGTIEVVKHVTGPADPSDTFNLALDGDVEAAGVADGGTTHAITVATGSHDVGEAAGTANLGDYNSSIECVDGEQHVAGGEGTSLDGVQVDEGAQVVCTITNARKTGTIEVVKHVTGPADPQDTFDLLVDGDVKADDVGDGGTTAQLTVPTGTHSVGEDGEHLDLYNSSTSCVDGEGQVDVAEGGQVQVDEGAHITCTITNDRKTGTLKVVKHLAPATDGGRFDLLVDGNAKASNVGDQGSTETLMLPTGSHDVAEQAHPDSGTVLSDYVTGTECSSDRNDEVASLRAAAVEEGATMAGEQSVWLHEGENVVCTITNQRRAIDIQKSGPAFAYNGDTLTFTYEVRNPGGAPLSNVVVTDDKCSAVTGPTSKTGGNEDDVLDAGEVWTYTCSHPAPTTQKGDPALVNTATVTAIDSHENTVTDTAQHTTVFLHPVVGIAKTGPASATAGDLLTYTLTITNPGDVSFAEPLTVVADQLCQAPPQRTGVNGDGSASSFDPGDTWTYSCQVQTQLGQPAVDNVATVKGTDQNGRSATAQATFRTELIQPRRELLPEKPVVSGTAKLRGPTGCPVGTRSASVTGRQIAKVVFYLDGKKVRTVTRPDSKGRWTLKVTPKRLRYGRHKVTAKVQFATASKTKAKTLRLSFNRCRPAITPKFTG